ncbi:extensin family protein [Agrobacterium rubi]|uniref:extensin-like domain-containing protein n=1 Tax=Agrobacterium rubi TaxID=28099 RepID=UPI0015726845|nr:extensin family protein [Agrobacterium rubi]NTF07790.1 extensin family protein [Agrobacterium rubi]NTF20034.1 extensin family protein [Agrobacterium rubi]NTF27005.1 extensin family protein [Agrobacterium rubi]
MAYVSLPRRVVTLLMMSTVIVSCSADSLVPPAEVDGSTRVSSIRSSHQQNYSAPSAPRAQSQPTNDYAPLSQPMPAEVTPSRDPLLQAGPGEQYSTLDAQQQRLGGGDVAVAPQTSSEMAEGEGGVNMDDGLGVAPVRGLAEEQDMEVSGSQSSQPMVDEAQSQIPMSPAPRRQLPSQSRLIPPPGEGQRQRQPVQDVAMLMPDNPTQERRMSSPPGMMPQSEVSCRSELRRLGVAFRDVARVSDGPTCGIDYPIELSGLASGVAIRPAVKLNCQVTLAFAKWVKFELVPSSRFRYLSGVERITPMGGYSCRKMNSRSSNPWSEHARGNAIDIGTITLKNGKEIDVRSKSIFAFREKGLLKAVRSDSCKYFSTVLGPGSDPSHWNHFHFDLRTRKSGYRHCS